MALSWTLQSMSTSEWKGWILLRGTACIPKCGGWWTEVTAQRTTSWSRLQAFKRYWYDLLFASHWRCSAVTPYLLSCCFNYQGCVCTQIMIMPGTNSCTPIASPWRIGTSQLYTLFSITFWKLECLVWKGFISVRDERICQNARWEWDHWTYSTRRCGKVL